MAAKNIIFRDFSGGLNQRDDPSELEENELPDCENITLDERGVAVKRLGYLDRFGAAIGTGLVQNLYYWAGQGKLVAQIGAGMHLDNGAAFKTWSTSDRCSMVEFGANLLMNHPVDGMFYYTGSGSPTAIASAPKGNAIAVWQNRLWSNDSAVTARLWYSPIGDPTAAWPGTNWVDLKEKDSAAITCLAGASGMDISGRPGLLVFKQDSTYRVHDSSSGAYTTVDPAVGCGGNIAAISAYGRTFVCSTRGIYSTDGLDPLREDSQLIGPFFEKTQINQSRPDLFCAGRYQDRLYFSFPRAGETANSVCIELHPIQHWVVPRTDAASAYASIGQNVTDLVMGDPVNAGRIHNTHKGGADNGTAITSRLVTSWREPNDGDKFRIRRLRVTGIGSFSLTPLKDYQLSGGYPARNVAITSSAGIYDSGYLYDNGVLYGPTKFQDKQDFWSIGVFRAVSLRVDETSSLVSSRTAILDGTTYQEKGAWSLSHIVALAFDLGTF